MIRAVQYPTPNVTPHRIPRPAMAAVLHVIEGSLGAADSWFANDASNVSAHFGIGRDGALHQYVSIHQVAWHAGRVLRPTWPMLTTGTISGNPNLVTIGIEHEGTGREPWTEAMWLTSTVLSAWLSLRFDWPLTTDRWPLHREIFAGKTCPGEAFTTAHRAEYVERVRALRAVFGADVRSLITGLR